MRTCDARHRRTLIWKSRRGASRATCIDVTVVSAGIFHLKPLNSPWNQARIPQHNKGLRLGFKKTTLNRRKCSRTYDPRRGFYGCTSPRELRSRAEQYYELRSSVDRPIVVRRPISTDMILRRLLKTTKNVAELKSRKKLLMGALLVRSKKNRRSSRTFSTRLILSRAGSFKLTLT